MLREYKVDYHHPRGGVSLGRNVCLNDASFSDRKALGKALRSAGVLSSGARVTRIERNAGYIAVSRITPHSSLECLPVILTPIPR